MKITVFLIHNPFVWNEPRTWLYEAIRFVSGSYFNHIAILYNGKVYEALEEGFKDYYTYDEWKSQKLRKIKSFSITLDKYQQERFYSLIGVKYDYFTLLFAHIFGKFFGNFKERGVNRVTCFEAVAYILDWFKNSKNGYGHVTGKHFEERIKF